MILALVQIRRSQPKRTRAVVTRTVALIEKNQESNRGIQVLPDKTIACIDCGTDFVFSEADQARHRELGYKTPKRCLECREKKRKRWGDGGSHPFDFPSREQS